MIVNVGIRTNEVSLIINIITTIITITIVIIIIITIIIAIIFLFHLDFDTAYTCVIRC